MGPAPQIVQEKLFDSFVPRFRNTVTYTILPLETMLLLATFPVEQIVYLGMQPSSKANPARKVDKLHIEGGFRYLIIDTLVVPPQETTEHDSRELRRPGEVVGAGGIESLGKRVAGISHKHPGKSIEMSSSTDIPFAERTRFDCYAVYSRDGKRANWYIRRDAEPDEFNNRGSFLLPCFPDHKDTEHTLSFPVRRGILRPAIYDKIEVPLGDGPTPNHIKTTINDMQVFQPEIRSFDLSTFDPTFTEPLQNYQFYCIVV